jgi:hypothetical protein
MSGSRCTDPAEEESCAAKSSSKAARTSFDSWPRPPKPPLPCPCSRHRTPPRGCRDQLIRKHPAISGKRTLPCIGAALTTAISGPQYAVRCSFWRSPARTPPHLRQRWIRLRRIPPERARRSSARPALWQVRTQQLPLGHPAGSSVDPPPPKVSGQTCQTTPRQATNGLTLVQVCTVSLDLDQFSVGPTIA